MSQNRYPGVKPFERSEQNIFFGRDQDREQLYELILLEKMVTLFGKSGYGKSSLLNAGILPRFEAAPKGEPEHFLPIQVRFGAYLPDGGQLTPVDHIRQQLSEALPPSPSMAFLSSLTPQDSLWKAFKQRQAAGQHRFLLVFDQFEELFTYPPELQAAFKQQLAELLYVAIPQHIRDAAEELPDDEYDHLVERMEVKAVFSIRSDRLSLLDQLKDALPAVLRIRYELKSLQADQARMAIVKPAGLPNTGGLNFLTAPFGYTPAAVDAILNNLVSSQTATQAGIESFLLQMICREIEYQVRSGEIQQRDESGRVLVTEEGLPDISNIYDQYYRRNLSLLPAGQQDAARLVIEEGLLLVNEKSDEYRRLSVDGGALIDRYREEGINEALLSSLVDAFLLRRERNSTGGFNYEISHDTLMRPIAQSRKQRRAEEERREYEQQRRAAEAKAAEETEKRREAQRLQQEAERGRRRAVVFSYMAIGLLLVALGASGWAWYSQQEAQQSLRKMHAAKSSENLRQAEQFLNRASHLDMLYPDAARALYLQADTLFQEADSLYQGGKEDDPLFQDVKRRLETKLQSN